MKRARQMRKAGKHMAAFNAIIPVRVQRKINIAVQEGRVLETPREIERRLLKRKRAKLARKLSRNKQWKKRRSRWR